MFSSAKGDNSLKVWNPSLGHTVLLLLILNVLLLCTQDCTCFIYLGDGILSEIELLSPNPHNKSKPWEKILKVLLASVALSVITPS